MLVSGCGGWEAKPEVASRPTAGTTTALQVVITDSKPLTVLFNGDGVRCTSANIADAMSQTKAPRCRSCSRREEHGRRVASPAGLTIRVSRLSPYKSDQYAAIGRGDKHFVTLTPRYAALFAS